MIPASTGVLVAGGGPVGLATAVELGRRGIDCLVVEPRATVSHARPRCKTVNVRTMEHLRRWGIADRLRERAPLPVAWSADIVFCTSLAGYELSRFGGVLGLRREGDRFAEPGQQAPQYVLEELLREVVRELPSCTLATGLAVTDLEQHPDGVRVQLGATDSGDTVARTVHADYVVGADGPRSAVRSLIGAGYVGEHALRPNFGMVFRAPDLWSHIRHGPAVQYWTISSDAPALLGPIDRDGTWWIIAFGVDRETGQREAHRIIDAAAGVPVGATVLSTDPWTARMQLVDRARDRRVFLAGDAAHLNPPFGGHGLNTGIGDAVDLGWKLAATLQGWGGPELLDSYEAERRPVQDKVIQAAESNMRTLSGDLLVDGLDEPGSAGDDARRQVGRRIQETKAAEFHALDLVLDVGYDRSPIVCDSGGRTGSPGARLPHATLADGRSVYDLLGPDLTLLVVGDRPTEVAALRRAAAGRRLPLTVTDVSDAGLRGRYGADLLLIRPDQHVAWRGGPLDDAAGVLDLVRGEPTPTRPAPAGPGARQP